MVPGVESQVVIIGAGPVGLSLAIELRQRSISCLVVERNERVGHAPRAKTTNVRTRTHLRRWGIADRLADASPFGIEYPSKVMFVTSLRGHILTSFDNCANCAPERNDLYPEHGQWIPQYKLEEVLRQRAIELGAVIEFNTEFLAASQAQDGVTADLISVGSGDRRRVACEYLVGADGARSTVREGLAIQMSGAYGLSRNYNVVFRAPGLAQAHGHGPAIMYWQVNARVPSLIGPMDSPDIWFFMPTKLPSDVQLGDTAAADLIRDATGIDLPYEILSSDEWVASQLIADRYRERRIFLAGDACHLHPPFGGYGMNMGIGDSVDLGWKIAAVLQGWAHPDLLDSYEPERRPVHVQIMDEAMANHAVLSNDFLDDALEQAGPVGEARRAEVGAKIANIKSREFKTLGAVLGYRYERSPVIIDDGGAPHRFDSQDYKPVNRPGCLAPHLWLDNDSSLYDRFGLGFALVVGGGTTRSEIERAVAEAARRKVPLQVVNDPEVGSTPFYKGRLTLVRPDQHVAWSGTSGWEKIFAVVTGAASGPAHVVETAGGPT